MAKGKSASAAQRRSQQRQVARQNKRVQQQLQQRRRKRNQTWFIFGGILIVVVAVIVLLTLVSQQNKPVTNTNKTVTNTTSKAVTNVSPDLLAQIGSGGISDTLLATQGSPALLTGPNGKPEVLYIGAEYCPYCAAERWSLITALSRFGTFSNLTGSASSASDVYPSTATFTFYGSTYKSSYIDFVAVETADQEQNSLQSLTSDQQKLLNTYDSSPYVASSQAGGIPFTDIGNRYINDGALFDPGVLHVTPSDPYSQSQSSEYIASQLTSSNTISKSILGGANYLTAAVCSITSNQPGSVCNTATIQKIESSLPKAKAQSGSGGASSAAGVDTTADVSSWTARRQA